MSAGLPSVMLEILFILILKLLDLILELRTALDFILSEIVHDLSIYIVLNERKKRISLTIILPYFIFPVVGS